MYSKIVYYQSVFSLKTNKGSIYLKTANSFSTIKLENLEPFIYSAILSTLKHDSAQWNNQEECVGIAMEQPID